MDKCLSRANPKWPRFATVGLALTLTVGLSATAAASSRRPNVTNAARATTTAKEVPLSWRGNDPPCSVRLPEQPGIVVHQKFHTCPPVRVLAIGDSVALTMATEMTFGEQNWGTIVENKSLLGCGFVIGHEVDFNGKFTAQNPKCDVENSTWQSDVKSFRPQAIIIEMGWWDSEPHLINGSEEDLSDTSYQNLVLSGMQALVTALRTYTAVPIYFLTVPWMDPQAWPNGEQNPGASPASHSEINALLADTVSKTTNAYLIDISSYITPEGHFQADVGGYACREADGVHLYVEVPGTEDFLQTPCGAHLQKGVLSTIRKTLSTK